MRARALARTLSSFYSANVGSSVTIRIKRAYVPPAESDGARILVDRLWPRGMKKERLALTAWLKEIAPSTALRKWFDHDPEKWEAFRRRYRAELDTRPELVSAALDFVRAGTTTLVFGSVDEQHNGAIVLRDYLLERVQQVG